MKKWHVIVEGSGANIVGILSSCCDAVVVLAIKEIFFFFRHSEKRSCEKPITFDIYKFSDRKTV